jgi:DhnA family fructose-bisphosphate aldolase class Ia
MTANEARAGWHEATRLVAHVAATMGADAVWHRLADDAGG